MEPLPPNPYTALGVDKKADIGTIKGAHRKLVMRCHPDKVPDKVEQFQSVQQAYELLSNEEERRRYDDRVQRDALRAEKGFSFGGPDFATGAGSGPVYEVHRETRSGKAYSTKTPRASWDDEPRAPPRKHKSSEEDDDYFSHKTDKARSAPRKHEENYFDSVPRRASGRSAFEDRSRRTRDIEEDFEREEQSRRYKQKDAKASEKKLRAEKVRTRDRDRKRDSEIKFKVRTSQGGYDDSSDSDRGSAFIRIAEPRDKYDEPRRRSEREDLPRRSRRGNESYSDEYDKEAEARRHIQKTRGTAHDTGPKRPPLFDRFQTTADARPPPPAPAAPPNDVRRSSGRRTSTRETSPIKLPTRERGGRNIEIVEPRGSSPKPRRPGLSVASSDPRGLRGMTGVKKATQKSATLDDIQEDRFPSIRRSETMPSQPHNRDPISASKGFKLKETNDSGYSSPGTPEMKNGASSFLRSSKYHNVMMDSPDSDSDEETIVMDDKRNVYRKGGRRSSLDRDNRRGSKSDRPAPSSTAHKHSASISSTPRGGPPLRSGSYAFTNDTLPARPPPLSRAETSRPIVAPPLSKEYSGRSGGRDRHLFGELKGDRGPYNKPDKGYNIVHERSKLSAEDINFADYGGGRRGSQDTTGARERDRYPGSHFSERDRRGREGRVH